VSALVGIGLTGLVGLVSAAGLIMASPDAARLAERWPRRPTVFA
jgi:hypothetical protein